MLLQISTPGYCFCPLKPQRNRTGNPSALCRLCPDTEKHSGNRKLTSPFQPATKTCGVSTGFSCTSTLYSQISRCCPESECLDLNQGFLRPKRSAIPASPHPDIKNYKAESNKIKTRLLRLKGKEENEQNYFQS